MKEYSILIVAIGCYYGHLREFIVNLKKKNPLVNVTMVISYLPDEVREELIENDCSIIQHKTYYGVIRYRYFVILMNVFYYCREFFGLLLKRHFDVVNIHFPTRHIKFAMPFLKLMTKNIVISPWGSDVLRVEDEKSINDLRKIYSQARFVTTGKNTNTGRCAIEKFKVDPDKFVELGWGGEFFDYIKDNPNHVTTEDAKKSFGLDGRYVITCGYNGQLEQRREEIVDAIYSVKNQLPNNLTLLFPYNYLKIPVNDANMETVMNKCASLGLEAVVVEQYLDMKGLLELRMATDIFVHVQTTDAGARSVMEYVLCNKKVVHGAWIKYAYLEDYKPSCYFPVDQIENLGECIVNAYHSEVSDLPEEVKTIIMERGWNYKMTLWNDFFESLV